MRCFVCNNSCISICCHWLKCPYILFPVHFDCYWYLHCTFTCTVVGVDVPIEFVAVQLYVPDATLCILEMVKVAPVWRTLLELSVLVQLHVMLVLGLAALTLHVMVADWPSVTRYGLDVIITSGLSEQCIKERSFGTPYILIYSSVKRLVFRLERSRRSVKVHFGQRSFIVSFKLKLLNFTWNERYIDWMPLFIVVMKHQPLQFY